MEQKNELWHVWQINIENDEGVIWTRDLYAETAAHAVKQAVQMANVNWIDNDLSVHAKDMGPIDAAG